MALLNLDTFIPLTPTTLLVSLCILTFLYFLITAIYNAFFHPLSHIPSPPLTTFSNIHLPLLSHLNALTPSLLRWHTQHGPILRYAPNRISFLSRRAVKEIYQDPSVDKDDTLYGLFTHYGASNAFSTRTAAQHGWRRKGVADRYSLSQVLRAEEATGGVSGRVAAYLGFIDRDGVPAGKEGTDRDVDLYMANIYYATDNVTGYLFGPSNTSNALGPASSPETREIRENIAAHYGQTRRARVDLYTTIGPLMRGYDAIVWGAQKVLQKAGLWEEIDTDWEGISRMRSWGWRRIEGVRRAGKEGRDVDGEYSVVSKLCGLVEQGKDGWTPEISGSEVMDHMLAGMDTTSDTLSFLMYHLSLPASRTLQSNFQASLDSLIPPGTTLPPAPTKSFLTALLAHPFIHAILHETFRFYPAIPLTLPRVVVQEGKHIDGVYIPPGTVVGSFAQGIHMDKEVFGEDVGVFRPERWLEAGEEKRKEMESRLWVFGSGGRGCVGRHLAVLEIKYLLAVLYSQYSTSTVTDDETELRVPHNQWNFRRTFRDTLPFKGVNGIIRFKLREKFCA